ncbi:MAG TPA: class I SAM-dependent methyltransferase [Saprospiraceae bacterium]|nr:class I SAM-dependent methyltransferase [Saprospiraceae bacterium]
MDKYQKTFATWNKIAIKYQEIFMDKDLYNDTYDVVWHSLTKEKSKLLDIGCGPGNITKYLLSKRPDFDIHGIDVAPNMITLATNNNPTATFAIMDTRDIQQLNGSFDGIICGFCIPYLSQTDTSKLINDCYNLLNDGGLLYLSFVEGDPKTSGYQIGSTGESVYFYYHLLDNIQSQITKNNFSEIEVFNVEYLKTTLEVEQHTIVIARKL